MTPGEGISILDQHEYCGKAMHHMPAIPTDAATGKSITLQNTMQTIGGSWC